MFSSSSVTGFTKHNAMPFVIGIAVGMLYPYVVKWFKGCTVESSKENLQKPVSTTFHIIQLEKGKNPKVVALTLEQFSSVATVERLNALRKSVHWGERSAKIWQGIFESSAHLVCALENKEVVAYGCLIGNGRMGMVTDVHVHPDRQRQGIGTLVMNDLVECLKPKEYAFVGLFGWEENKTVLQFYKRFGFKPNPHGMESSSSDLIRVGTEEAIRKDGAESL
jgi:GNAT superfamily N-acetyltransferase